MCFYKITKKIISVNNNFIFIPIKLIKINNYSVLLNGCMVWGQGQYQVQTEKQVTGIFSFWNLCHKPPAMNPSEFWILQTLYWISCARI